ncbi:hypothetical protein [Paracidovorax cattleyae]|uniref:Uncharacterized protein n=1 Tax=Paracidovorax cattleyae TaxID=80868 RepID=A0A1H0WPV4_9BURK|nr:hypothetical protein [Paracidovorax cattleyae]SDP92306.1 hypothetical protein SAMN04489708_14515 [Paracidovorax cattleyae]
MVNVVYALQRARHGEQPFWMAMTLAALLDAVDDFIPVDRPGPALRHRTARHHGTGA